MCCVIITVSDLLHLTVRKLPTEKGRVDSACRGKLSWLSVYSEVHVMHGRRKGKVRWERANRYLPVYRKNVVMWIYGWSKIYKKCVAFFFHGHFHSCLPSAPITYWNRNCAGIEILQTVSFSFLFLFFFFFKDMFVLKKNNNNTMCSFVFIHYLQLNSVSQIS